MGYYNYHAQVINRIKQGKLKSYHFEKNYKGIGFALVLKFDDKKFPIREKHFEIYFDLIGNYYLTQKIFDEYFTTPINFEKDY